MSSTSVLFKSGDDFGLLYYIEADEPFLTITGRSQIRDGDNVLLSDLDVRAEMMGPRTALVQVSAPRSETVRWPYGSLYTDAQLVIDGFETSTATIQVLNRKGVTDG